MGGPTQGLACALRPLLLQATIFCGTARRVRFGSHTIFIGTVLDACLNDNTAPLMFRNGQYGSYAPLAGSPAAAE